MAARRKKTPASKARSKNSPTTTKKNPATPKVDPEDAMWFCDATHNKPQPPELVEAVAHLEKSLGLPAVLLLQDGRDNYLHDGVVQQLRASVARMPPTKVALVIDSPGGSARAAYQIAQMLSRHCGSFVAVVPRYAKSAATLLSLGAERILLGQHGELGPLDAQISDADKEEGFSALDEVQSLERLNKFSLQAINETLFLLMLRSGKKIGTLLPLTLDYVAKLMGPLLTQVDVVRYTQTSRVLRVAQEYAKRLMSPNYSNPNKIVQKLVEEYPEHGFVIDFDEAKQLGLKVDQFSDEQNDAIDPILPLLGRIDAVGRLAQRQP